MKSPSSIHGVTGPCAAIAVAVSLGATTWGVSAAAQGTASPPTPTLLEQAVMEHNCRVPGQAMPPADLYETCLRDQLTFLRAEFGKDLRKLSAPERGTIDRACTALRVERGRDEYVACLADRLARLANARGRAVPSPPTVAAATPPAATGSTETPTGPRAPSEPSPVDTPASATSGSWAWLGGLLALVAGVGAWSVMSRRPSKPALALCRVCGELAQAGDLCATCRHEAAEAQRRASVDRPDAQMPIEDQPRRPEVPADVVPRTDAPSAPRADDTASAVSAQAAQAAQVLEARRREHEQAVQARTEREREEARQQESERRRWQEAAAAAIAEDSPIDPHTVLGVTADASPEEIRAAYDEARRKYAPDLVSHLGGELQELYRTKAQAVERAYELLLGADLQGSTDSTAA